MCEPRTSSDGVDPQVEPWRPLTHLGRGIGFGFPPGPLPRDPTSGRPIGGSRDDPIRFNSSDLASFSAAGTATPGSVYLTDGRRGLVVVRVTNVSGRVRTLRWDHDDALGARSDRGAGEFDRLRSLGYRRSTVAKALLVLTTADSEDLAKRLADTLVKRHQAACVNIVPGMTSVYRWSGKIKRTPSCCS